LNNDGDHGRAPEIPAAAGSIGYAWLWLSTRLHLTPFASISLSLQRNNYIAMQ